MMRLRPALQQFALPLMLTALCLRVPGDPAPISSPARMAFPAAMPATVLWAWEEPEDLRSAPADRMGVAFLDETLLLTAAGGKPCISILHRHQPLAVAPGASVMAVVRIMALPGFQDSDALREQTAAALAEAAAQPGLRALQVDFDATRSQRAFYADVLRRLRPRINPAMPLSITALLSWCAASPANSWLAGLPIDEAVPMFFRLGGRARPADSKLGYTLREPICRGSIGISTDESWPQLSPHQRIYLFAPRPWTAAQLAAVGDITGSARPRAFQFNPAQPPANDTGLHGRDFDPPPATLENQP